MCFNQSGQLGGSRQSQMHNARKLKTAARSPPYYSQTAQIPRLGILGILCAQCAQYCVCTNSKPCLHTKHRIYWTFCTALHGTKLIRTLLSLSISYHPPPPPKKQLYTIPPHSFLDIKQNTAEMQTALQLLDSCTEPSQSGTIF